MLMALLVYVLGMPFGIVMAWISIQMALYNNFAVLGRVMYPWPENYSDSQMAMPVNPCGYYLDGVNNLSIAEQQKKVAGYIALSLLFWPIRLVWIAFFALFFYPFVWVIKTLYRIGAFVYNKLIFPALLPLARFLAS